MQKYVLVKRGSRAFFFLSELLMGPPHHEEVSLLHKIKHVILIWVWRSYRMYWFIVCVNCEIVSRKSKVADLVIFYKKKPNQMNAAFNCLWLVLPAAF